MSDVGVAWYSQETWKRLAANPEAHIEKSYGDLLRTFDTMVRKFAARGVQVEKVSVDIDQMIEWCHRNGYEIDSKGRAVYGSMLMLARDDPRVLGQPVVDNTRVVQ